MSHHPRVLPDYWVNQLSPVKWRLGRLPNWIKLTQGLKIMHDASHVSALQAHSCDNWRNSTGNWVKWRVPQRQREGQQWALLRYMHIVQHVLIVRNGHGLLFCCVSLCSFKWQLSVHGVIEFGFPPFWSHRAWNSCVYQPLGAKWTICTHKWTPIHMHTNTHTLPQWTKKRLPEVDNKIVWNALVVKVLLQLFDADFLFHQSHHLHELNM